MSSLARKMPKMTKHIKPMAALMPIEIPNEEPEAAIGRYQQADLTAPISTACTSTSTLTPSHTHTPSSTGLPFGGETVGYFKVLHQNKKVGWLTEAGELSAQGSKRGVFYPTYECEFDMTFPFTFPSETDPL